MIALSDPELRRSSHDSSAAGTLELQLDGSERSEGSRAAHASGRSIANLPRLPGDKVLPLSAVNICCAGSVHERSLQAIVTRQKYTSAA